MNQKSQSASDSLKDILTDTQVKRSIYADNGDDICYARVDLPELGMFVNSITIRPNPRNPDKLWVQMPKFRIGPSRWIAPLEFKTGSVIREIVVKQALTAWYETYGPEGDESLREFIDKHYP
jgi:hypothetical protein